MPTALELTREEWDPYIRAAARRPRAMMPGPVEIEQREALLERASRVAAQLKQRFGVRRVILFGSLAHGAWYLDDSDIDLAVEGLQGADFWAAWRLAEDIIAVRPVDLIDYEAASDSLRAAIERSGIEL
jgi:uncharacterized protein